MSGTFLDALGEVLSDPIVIDDTPAGVLREARGNLWSFTVTQRQARDLSPEAVCHFILAVVRARSEYLASRYSMSHPMECYCWCGEQAVQLRLSLISAVHGCLPFTGATAVITDLALVVAQFIALTNHDGIPICTIDDAIDTPVVEEAGQPVQVWICRIPFPPAVKE